MFNTISVMAKAAAPYVGQAALLGGKVVIAAGIASKANKAIKDNASEMVEQLGLARMEAQIQRDEHHIVETTIGFQHDDVNTA